MSKDPTPRADALRAQREARFGHLQAHITEEKSSDVMKAVAPMMKPKLIPYAGKSPGSRDDLIGNKPPNTKPPRERRKYKRKTS